MTKHNIEVVLNGPDRARRRFTAKSWMVSHAGSLSLYSGSGKSGNIVAHFAPGSWAYLRELKSNG